MIYSHGYCTLFDEWKFTDEAKLTQRTYSESVVMPYPLHETIVDFYSRNDQAFLKKNSATRLIPKARISTQRLSSNTPCMSRWSTAMLP